MPDTYADIVAAARDVTTELVTVERASDHALVRLADPDKRNVLSAALMLQLRERTEELVGDPSIRSVVLTGSGPAFSAGGDLRMMATFTASTGGDEGAFLPYQWIRRQFGAYARLIAHSETVFVAALNGPAAGVGLAFALTCDIALAAEDAVLVPAFGRVGLIPEVGTSWALTRALGYRRAFAYFIGGEQLDATRAVELGLVDEVVPAEELLPRAITWCDRVAALPQHAVPLAKPLLRAAADSSWEQTLTYEEFAEPICFTTRGFADSVDRVVAATAQHSTR